MTPDGTPWPEPEIRARPATETDPVPNSARLALQRARRTGWDAHLKYARGTAPSSRIIWMPGPVVDSVAFLAHRSGIRVFATWDDGKFRNAWLLLPACWPHQMSSRQMTDLLTAASAQP